MKAQTFLGPISALALTSACELQQPVHVGPATFLPNSAAPRVIEVLSPDTVVCDPLAGNSEPTPTEVRGGIRGRLYSIASWETCLWQRNCLILPVQDFLAEAEDLNLNVFMKDINVPTRAFDAGFETQTGALIRDPQGVFLYEWFGLDLRATVKLANGDAAGHYQFAVISDDGVRFELDHDGMGFRPVVNDPLIHAPKLGCGTRTFELNGESRIPMRLRYFQGPRFHIALQLLWRRIPESQLSNPGFLQSSNCGNQGVDLFHDSNTVPSTPRPAYEQLLSEGWRPLSPENFVLPETSANNPCTPTGGGPIGGGIGI
jgi:hypothetical protein